MKVAFAILLIAFSLAHGDLVRERWADRATPCTHPGTLKIIHGRGTQRILFDLSALPKGARIHHASLFCFTERGRQPTEPARLLMVRKLDANGNPELVAEPLRLEAPWYRSFDVTQAVRQWSKEPGQNLGIAVEQFEGLIVTKTYLEILYEGTPRAVPEQVIGVRAVHHKGQTFVVWKEHSSYQPEPDEVIWVEKFAEGGDTVTQGPGDGAYGMTNHPAITLTALRRLQGLALRDKPSNFQGIKGLKRSRKVQPITYRVYRHTGEITAKNLHEAALLAEVPPLNGYDTQVYKIHFRGEFLNQREEPTSVIPTFRIGTGEALLPGDALYVHTTDAPGRFHYAVTTALSGTENLTELSGMNSLSDAVVESPGTPLPVLQWTQEDRYHKDVPEHWYRYWAAPPFCNQPSRSLRVAVSVPPKFREPGPLIIGSISGAFNIRGMLRLPSRSAITLLVQRQLDWLPALFYNEGRGTLRALTACKVDYFSERYMSFMIEWLMGRHRIDRSKIRGSLLHFGLRHPEIFTRMSMGTYTAGYDLRFAPGGPSMPVVLGARGVMTTKGEDAWKMYSVSEYVNTYPDRDIPFLVCISATGKDSGHTSEFGWQDDPRGWAGLLKARQPFVASWSLGPPGELSRAFGRMRWDVTLPAFSNCSLDNNPGNGDPTDGDYYGCINGWLLWGDQDSVDEKSRWEMTTWVISSCPDDECTVDLTPRHCRNFKPRRGQTLKWTNTALADNNVVQSGEVTADEWGLVTLERLEVSKGKNRIVIAVP